jgi:5,10-methylenetetrahydromethanopterin reductase
MKLGAIALWGDDLEAFRRQVRLAEQLGCDVIGVGDSPAAWNDMFVSLAIAAFETEHATLTPMVTSPGLRHPSIAASSISTIHELSGGRTVFTIGAGGSALGTIGRRKSAPREEMRAYVTAVKELLNGGQPEVDGLQVARLSRARPMPVFMSADGPRGLELAGEIADGVVIAVGSSLDLVDRKLETVRAAAEKVGRDPDSIDIWCMTFVSVRPTKDEANNDVTALLASTAGMGMKAPYMRAIIPPELLGAFEEMEKRYDPSAHVVVGGKNAQLLEELGLVDFMLGVRGVTGLPDEVGALFKELDARGISTVLVSMPGNADPEGTLTRVSEALRG